MLEEEKKYGRQSFIEFLIPSSSHFSHSIKMDVEDVMNEKSETFINPGERKKFIYLS